MRVQGVRDEWVDGFVRWLAGIALQRRYDELGVEPDREERETNVETLYESVVFWATESDGEKTWQEVYEFMLADLEAYMA